MLMQIKRNKNAVGVTSVIYIITESPIMFIIHWLMTMRVPIPVWFRSLIRRLIKWSYKIFLSEIGAPFQLALKSSKLN